MFASELHPRLPRHPKMKASSQSNRLHLFHSEAVGWEKEKKKGRKRVHSDRHWFLFPRIPKQISQFHHFILAEICSSLSQRIRRKRTSVIVFNKPFSVEWMLLSISVQPGSLGGTSLGSMLQVLSSLVGCDIW